MRNRLMRSGFALALTAGMAGLNAVRAADEPTSPGASGNAAPVQTRTPWGSYVSVSNVSAEVRAVDGQSITLRVYWMAPTPGAKTGKRPNLSSGRGHQNPMQMMMKMAKANQPKLHQEHHDYVVSYFPDTTVRGMVGKVKATTPTDLVPGTVVEALLIRDKAVAMKDTKDTDLKVKALTAHGANPNYHADAAATAKKK